MPAVTDYYAVLGVDSDASQKEIKTAYRAKARALHPDTNPGDAAAEEQFKAVQQAYAAVGDEAKRAAYDRARQNPYGGGSPFGGFGGQTSAPSGAGRFYRTPDGTYVRVDATGAGPGPEPGGDFTFGGDGIGDLFERYFGGAQGGAPGGPQAPRGPAPRGGRDVEATVRLSFEEALAGGPQEFTAPGGETVRVTVPQGVRDGLRLKLAGRGEPAPGGRGAPGDLFLTVHVTPDARFRRDGDDLARTHAITAVEAMLGTTLSVATAYGQTVRLRVKPGTAPGAKLRVKGQGVRTASGAGDLTVEIDVAVPVLSDEARDGLRAWAETHGLAPGERASGE